MENEVTGELKNLPIAEIKPYWRNARNNDKTVEMLKRIISKDGFQVPIYVDKDYVIIRGHARLKAVTQLGWTHIPAMVDENISDEDAKEIRITDNKVSELAEWVHDDLVIELRELGMDRMEPYFPELDMTKAVNTSVGIGNTSPSETQIANTQTKLDNKFTGITEKREDDQFELTCPNCDESYFVAKSTLLKMLGQ